MTKPTPMMVQYQAIKDQYQDAFLFFRLGDFYELFNEDAVEAAKILEITLTSRNKNADNPIPMAGVPYHAAGDYIKKLIQAGHKVAICEQVEDPKLTKGMVKREVVRVITPGTILDEDALKSKENNYISAVYTYQETYWLAYADVSTGEIAVTQTDNQLSFFSELQSLSPTELILDPNHWSEEMAGKIRQLTQAYISEVDLKTIRQQASVDWQLEDAKRGEVDVLDLLVGYIRTVQKQTLSHLQPVNRYELKNYLQMNHYAKAQLELTKSLRTQRKKGSLLWLLDQTKTAMGGRMLHQWLDKPLLDAHQLSQRHDKVVALMRHYFERVDLVSALNHVYDLERLVTKIAIGNANGRDLDQLRMSLSQMPRLNQLLEVINEAEETPIFDVLDDHQALYQTIDKWLIDEPPLSITEGGIIKDGADSQLDEYRDALANGQTWLADLQMRERERTGLKTLKVGYNKVFGYYIEISRLQAQNFDDPRYERKQTLANSERYITEELKEIETTITSAQDSLEALEYKLFVDLRNYVHTFRDSLQQLASQIAALDVLANFAQLSEMYNYVRPQLVAEPYHMKLIESRHPVVEQLLDSGEFVANDFNVSSDAYLLLLTGPNMSGKSTFMRQVAYCVIMNQIGCFVPATEAELPLVDKIFTRIGSADDISTGQSTFMVEMMETNTALQQATSRSLLLFDEIGRGTATYDGMALAQGVIEYVAKEVKAVMIFATHYHELTQLDQDIPTLTNIHVGASEHNGNIVFLHRILEGPADKSYGIHVAKLAGLPDKLIERSQMVLDQLESQSRLMAEHYQNQDVVKDEQLSLFNLAPEEAPTSNPVVETLKTININDLTPLEALNVLHQLQKEVQE